MKKRPHHIEYSQRIAELVEQYGIPDPGQWASLSPLWGALLGVEGLVWEEREEICRTGKSPAYWEPRREGRTGYAAKIKGDAIIIEEWSAGVKQRHMELSIPVAQWPVRLSWDVPNLVFAQSEVCERAIAEMAKRVFNEEWGPHMVRQADAMRGAIYKVLPESVPAEIKAAKANAKKKR